MSDMNLIGHILFWGALVVFVIFAMYWYIPHITADPSNAKILQTAIWWGVGCGAVGTIGLVMAKSK